MWDFSRPLGDAVRAARLKKHMTQEQVAGQLGLDSRTILNIENCKANPLMENLYPLIRLLEIDPWPVFYPERKSEGASLRALNLLIQDCSDEEISLLLPFCREALALIRRTDGKHIE